MKHLFLSFLFLILPSTLLAAVPGQWNYYLAYHEASSVAPAKQCVYALFNGNLLSYDAETEEVHLFTKNDGLTGRSIAHIGYSSSASTLVIVYEDLGIDLLSDDGSICTIDYLKEASDGTLAVNDLTIVGSEALLSTTDGIVCLDLKESVLRGYYKLSQSVKSATMLNGRFFVVTAQGVLSCATQGNPSDPSNWTLMFETNYGTQITAFAQHIYLTITDQNALGTWIASAPAASDATLNFSRLSWYRSEKFYATPDVLLLRHGSDAFFISADAPTAIASQFTLPSSVCSAAPTSASSLWAALGDEGVKKFSIANGELQEEGSAIGGYGPKRDLCYYLSFTGNRLLVGGGRLDPLDQLHYKGTVMVYENEKWRAFQDDGATMDNFPFRDVTCVVQNPADSSCHYVSCGGGGLYQFSGGRFVRHLSTNNSPLQSAAGGGNPYYVRIDGLNYDKAGNLWMLNMGADSVVVILSPDDTWTRLRVPSLSLATQMQKTLFDSDGRFWICSRRSATGHDAGLACIDYGGTLSTDDDDTYTFRSSVSNQDGTACSFSEGVYDLMEDTDGSLWVATGGGLYVIDDPSTWSSSSFYITQIKVPRNDGTNYADYLLAGVPCNALALDGAGRKWVGTLGNGLYLLSADGLTVVHHFLAASSPLLSDNIYSLAIDPTTGEVFVGTDQGLCSFQGDATAPAESLSKDALTVSPNPLTSRHSGPVIIRGFTADADVKIVSAAGQVVAKGTSLGGTFTWDGRTTDGARAASGVYYIMTTTADGSTSVCGKFVVIN